jgi:hypothetical protein
MRSMVIGNLPRLKLFQKKSCAAERRSPDAAEAPAAVGNPRFRLG